ncbi:MAG: ribonuclease P protein component [Candidatus Omnitrophota bacterium]
MRHIAQKQEFTEIFERGERKKGTYLSFYLLGAEQEPEIAVGLVISKKVAKKAVIRNYLRRTIYAFFRENRNNFQKGFKLIVRGIKEVSELKKKDLSLEIRKELDFLCSMSGIKNDKSIDFDH